MAKRRKFTSKFWLLGLTVIFFSCEKKVVPLEPPSTLANSFATAWLNRRYDSLDHRMTGAAHSKWIHERSQSANFPPDSDFLATPLIYDSILQASSADFFSTVTFPQASEGIQRTRIKISLALDDTWKVTNYQYLREDE